MTIFVDVDTQLDFLAPAGALYVPGAEGIVHALGRLNRYAIDHNIPLLSTADAHAENDPEFRQWPPHCVKGTLGQRKCAATLTGSVTVLRSRSDRAAHLLVEKQSTDCFTNPTLDAWLKENRPDRAIVYGVVTEICVRRAAFGLLRRGIPTVIVTDAVRCLDENQARAMFDEFLSAGGRLATVSEICAAAA
jgi:nicotinamidase/pyrazinamidase